MTVQGETAEWNCTRCSTTNRKLVPRGTGEFIDVCLSCKARHLIRPGQRPVRWDATLAG